MRLRRRHLVHQVGGVDGLVLRLGVQQIRVDGVAEEERVNCLALVDVVVREQRLEVRVGAVVGSVELVGPEVGALRAKMRAR